MFSHLKVKVTTMKGLTQAGEAGNENQPQIEMFTDTPLVLLLETIHQIYQYICALHVCDEAEH